MSESEKFWKEQNSLPPEKEKQFLLNGFLTKILGFDFKNQNLK